jgi:hypothetical protein
VDAEEVGYEGSVVKKTLMGTIPGWSWARQLRNPRRGSYGHPPCVEVLLKMELTMRAYQSVAKKRGHGPGSTRQRMITEASTREAVRRDPLVGTSVWLMGRAGSGLAGPRGH